ncbi:hypothetical protein BS50DRAFT_633380 [Corynespora cassiicola Philippines]|uniref:Nicotinamide N-methyltransferase n=1 Tax=Corynespora cassiicola Philippines TaxID=1448308 RepID=A0A2T2NQH2_CORCC|nr:hypothetical protein BS50DRAFT_633380 [Corynespora cassiicola Philippines]
MHPLPTHISLLHPPSHVDGPEDIFGPALGPIFTDDLQNMHGDDDEGTRVVYSPSNGAVVVGGGDGGEGGNKGEVVELATARISGEEERGKYAHYLWNAGVLVGELVSGRGEGGKEEGEEWWVDGEEEGWWDVTGEKVLELGAGVGLGGIMSALAGAEEVTITDYPAPSLLSTLRQNASHNLPPALQSRTTVQGHKWGDLTSPFACSHAGRYTRVLAADCLWMPHEHANLARSMLHFLSPQDPRARVLVVAGFHTGRAKLARFFEEAVPAEGLEVERIFEVDAEGRRRTWDAGRGGGREDVGERKKWLVVARLRRGDVRAP